MQAARDIPAKDPAPAPFCSSAECAPAAPYAHSPEHVDASVCVRACVRTCAPHQVRNHAGFSMQARAKVCRLLHVRTPASHSLCCLYPAAMFTGQPTCHLHPSLPPFHTYPHAPTHTHTHTSTYTFPCSHSLTYPHIPTRMHTHTHSHARVRSCTHTYPHTNTHTYTFPRSHVLVHPQIPTRTHTRTHKHSHLFACSHIPRHADPLPCSWASRPARCSLGRPQTPHQASLVTLHLISGTVQLLLLWMPQALMWVPQALTEPVAERQQKLPGQLQMLEQGVQAVLH